MSTQLRSSLLNFFGEGKLPELEAVIRARVESYQSMIPILFNQENMTSDIYQTTSYSGLKNPKVKEENQPVEFQTIQPGFPKTYTSKCYATGYRISRETVRDGKESFIQRATESFAKGNFEVRELNAASVLDDGFTVNGYDGVPLFSDQHPLENGDGQYGVNTPTDGSELSISSYRELRNILQDTVNEDGQKVKYRAQYLVVGQDLQDDAAEILKSQYNPENANNAINTVYNHTQLLPEGYWPYLESSTAFFLFTQKMDHHLMFLQRDPFETDSDYDKHTFAYEIIASERHAFGYSGWRGVVGNPGE